MIGLRLESTQVTFRRCFKILFQEIDHAEIGPRGIVFRISFNDRAQSRYGLSKILPIDFASCSLVEGTVLTGALVSVCRDDSGASPRRPFPSKFQILPDVLHCICRDQYRHARYFYAVELHREVVITIEDIVEAISSIVADPLSPENFISSRIKDHVERYVRVRVGNLRLVNL